MKRKLSNLASVAVVFSLVGAAYGQLSVGSDGSDGVFSPTADVVVDLTLAPDATWDTPGAGDGVYDADKWAVVFKFQSVNIPAGVTVFFKNHRSTAPVVWLVSDSVSIAGTLNLAGKRVLPATLAEPAVPGPGGFRGGSISPASDGYGPGGGRIAVSTKGFYAGSYGNPGIVPLIGGSGGASPFTAGRGGGAGGGAILIAAGNTIDIGGLINASGGSAGGATDRTGGGAGGGVRLVATAVTGSGAVSATGLGSGGGGVGIIRVEANSISGTLGLSGGLTQDIPSNPPNIWPPNGSPKIRVASIDFIDASGVTQSVPFSQDPEGRLDFPNADAAILTDQPVTLNIEAQNVPLDWIVIIRIVPKAGQTLVVAAPALVGTTAISTTSINLALFGGFSTIQVRASAPI